jgi:hypothetical protein
MSIKNLSIALTSVLVMAAGVPAFAETINTNGTSQTGVQTNDSTGRGNVGVNNSNQSSSTRQSGRRTDNQSATVQSIDQLNRADGRGNVGVNNSNQRSNVRQSR